MLRTGFIALTLLAAACGPSRTTAATQPTPAAFDPAKSDPKALEVVDASLPALGGAPAWEAVKQLKFTAKYVLDGEVKGHYVHAWDRWNGRHNLRMADLTADQSKGTPWIEVFYDLFDADAKPHATYDGKEVQREDADRFRKTARDRLAEDAYMLTMIHKLRDPGVQLQLAGETPEASGKCVGGCTLVQVTFDPAVGKDTWFVSYNKETKLPEIIDKQKGTGRIGFSIEEWTEAGGLKFPAKLQNIGLPGEVFEFSEIEIGEPDDALYIPQVTGAGGE